MRRSLASVVEGMRRRVGVEPLILRVLFVGKAATVDLLVLEVLDDGIVALIDGGGTSGAAFPYSTMIRIEEAPTE